MSRTGKLVVIMACVWCIGSIVFFAHRTPLLQFLSIPFALAFFAAGVASVVLVFTDWRRHSLRCILPLASCVVAFVLSEILVQAARKLIFRWSFPSYEAIVRQMENGGIPVSTNFCHILQAEGKARLAYGVLAGKKTNGDLTVIFLTESGFPVKHSGYLYVSSGVIAPGMKEWCPIREEVRGKWFYISN